MEGNNIARHKRNTGNCTTVEFQNMKEEKETRKSRKFEINDEMLLVVRLGHFAHFARAAGALLVRKGYCCCAPPLLQTLSSCTVCCGDLYTAVCSAETEIIKRTRPLSSAVYRAVWRG